jgi:poly(A) polymerase
LLNIQPKDFDIATSALPNEVKKTVPNSFVIGKRFRLVLVRRGLDQFEVATFRRDPSPEEIAELFAEEQEAKTGGDEPLHLGQDVDLDSEQPNEARQTVFQRDIEQEIQQPRKKRISTENFFGSPEQDALRRDFTINALFYDPQKEIILDHTRGLEDLELRVLRMIGEPLQRLKEDPVRALRAIRLSHKVGFTIEPKLRSLLGTSGEALTLTPLARRREEYLKILKINEPIAALLEMYDLGLLKSCLPSLTPIFDEPELRDAFFEPLRNRAQYILDSSRPLSWYLPVFLGYQEAIKLKPSLAQQRESLFRFELGLFRSEFADLLSFFETKNRLKNPETFLRKGERRKKAFLEAPLLNEALLALKTSFSLSPDQVLFWQDQLSGESEFKFELKWKSKSKSKPQPSGQVRPD